MEIKGAILESRLQFVRERFGAEAVEQVLTALPNPVQSVLRKPLNSSGWYNFQICLHLDDAIVRVIGKGDPRLFEEMGAASARQNLGGTQKFYLDPGNPQGFMLRAPLIYNVYYDKGWRDYKPTSPTSGVMTTYEADTYSEADCMTVMGWYKQALKMCGARNVDIVEETCRSRGGDCCKYVVSWS
jgi:hypothetical protein